MHVFAFVLIVSSNTPSAYILSWAQWKLNR